MQQVLELGRAEVRFGLQFSQLAPLPHRLQFGPHFARAGATPPPQLLRLSQHPLGLVERSLQPLLRVRVSSGAAHGAHCVRDRGRRARNRPVAIVRRHRRWRVRKRRGPTEIKTKPVTAPVVTTAVPADATRGARRKRR